MLKKKKNKLKTLGNFLLLPKSKDIAHARQFLPLKQFFFFQKPKKPNFCSRNVKNLASCILLGKKHKIWRFMIVMKNKTPKNTSIYK